MKTKLSVYFILFFHSFSPVSNAQNLIINPSFESGTRAYNTQVIPASWPSLKGLWKFDNTASPLLATVGPNLTLTGTHTLIAGYSGTDNAVRIGPGCNYSVTHGIPGNGGSATYVNAYSLLFDFRIAALGDWKTFYQTEETNSNDADLWVRSTDGMIGVGGVGYSAEGAIPNVWHRLVVSVSNGSFFRIYLDGRLVSNGPGQPVDGRFSLDPKIYFMSDDDGEDGIIDVSTIALFDKALTQTEVESLGRWTCDNWLNMGNYQQQYRPGGYATAFAGNYYLFAGADTPLDSYQDVNVSGDAVAIDAGAASYTFAGKLQTYSQSPQDQARIIVEYRNAGGTVLYSYDTGNQTTSSNWVNFSNTITAPSLTRTIRIRLIHTKNAGTMCDTYYDDFSLTKLISLEISALNLYKPTFENKTCGLQWKFEGAEDPDRFDIEKSTDAEHWETLHRLGYMKHRPVYSWTDDDNLNEPVYYYRIKGIGQQGQVFYSNTQSISTAEFPAGGLDVRIQNPGKVNEDFTIYPNCPDCEITIFDASGKLVHHYVSTPRGSLTVKFATSGIYTLLITYKGQVLVRKISVI